MNIAELLSEPESEYLDFKEKFHSCNVELLHDILCLANSYHHGDRYIIFGVTDKDRAICGIEHDENKKQTEDIQNLLRNANLNRHPTVRLQFIKYEQHELAVMTIENRPDKPFFLTKPKKKNKLYINAGAIYSRLGNTNTPITETALDFDVELMWRERFGIGLGPLSRVRRMLEDKNKWVRREGDSYLYHKDFPEFTIVDGEVLNPNFIDKWANSFPDPHANSFYVEIKYFTTVLERLPFLNVDGGRYKLPFHEVDKDRVRFIIKNSIAYMIAEIYDQYFPIDTALRRMSVELR